MLKVKNNLSKQEIYQTAVFGTLWALLEITLGTWLHLSKVPFRGILLSVIAAILLTTSKRIIDYKGSLIALGLICSSIKTVVSGVFILNPIFAIIFESIIAEIFFAILKSGMFGSIIVGALVLFYTFLHSLIAQLFFFGFEIFLVYNRLIAKFIPIKTDNEYLIYFIILIYATFHLIFGALGGFIGFRIGSMTLNLMRDQNVNN